MQGNQTIQATATEMASVKAVAAVLLNWDVKRTAFSPAVVQHPFTSSGFVGIRPEPNAPMKIVDITRDSQALQKWRAGQSRQIEQAERAYEVFMMINTPYALTFLKLAQPYLSQKDFSKILSDAWITSEYTNSGGGPKKSELVKMFASADPSVLMTEEERNLLADLDNPVTVYRGVTSYNGKNLRALSWTLKYDTAAWFAHRFEEDGSVYEAQIEKKHIFALFCGRNEAEIVLDPKYLRDITPAQAPEQESCYDKQAQQEYAKKHIVGKVSFANGERITFENAEKYLTTIREELPYRDTTGFRFETLTDDPAVRKAVDDMICDLYGEDNPRPLEDYEKTTPEQGMSMGGL